MTKNWFLENFDVRQEVIQAEKRIKRYIRKTPLEYSHYLSDASNSNVFLKLENFQVTGSFKVRGAFNKILSLVSEDKNRFFVTASTGNHGLAVAYALNKLGLNGKIILTEGTSEAKLEPLKRFKIPLEFHGRDCEETETFARSVAHKKSQTFISPYNDPQIISGQGTIGLEIFKQLPEVDFVFTSVGGGGLISGIAGYLKSVKKDVQIIGCLPENSPVMYQSVKAGKIIKSKVKGKVFN